MGTPTLMPYQRGEGTHGVERGCPILFLLIPTHFGPQDPTTVSLPTPQAPGTFPLLCVGTRRGHPLRRGFTGLSPPMPTDLCTPHIPRAAPYSGWHHTPRPSPLDTLTLSSPDSRPWFLQPPPSSLPGIHHHTRSLQKEPRGPHSGWVLCFPT